MSETAAIIIGGAVAKGAFAAGVLTVLVERLAEQNVKIVRVVGTSSGALNAVFLAAGIRRRNGVEATKRLVSLWRDKATVCEFLDWDPTGTFGGKGFSSMDKVVNLLRKKTAEIPAGMGQPENISASVIVTSLAGRADQHEDTPVRHTTFEAVTTIKNEEFDSPDRLCKMFRAAAASATFPILFEPTAVPDTGACLDGGLVDNTPIAELLKDTPEDLSRLYVISAEPDDMTLSQEAAGDLSWYTLFQRSVEIVIYERLCRDLRRARKRNTAIRNIDGLGLGSKTEEVYKALGWKQHRILDLVEIRPEKELPGNPVSGFFCDDLRETYVRQGEDRARKVLP